MTERFELRHGDSRDELKLLGSAHVDALVTDPPAGIGFMGKGWDHDHGGREEWIDAFSVIFAECLRVLKPGAHGLVWALPRTSHWTATALEEAGFEIRDRVSYLFGTGFPKSLNVSKAIDKTRAPADRVRAATAWMRERCESLNLTTRDLDAACGTNGMGGHWTTQAAQAAIPTAEQWEKLGQLVGPPPEWLVPLILPARQPGEAWERREVIGEHPAPATRIYSDREMPDVVPLTASATELARAWEGWGTALKPACEDWWLVRKPLDGTVAANVAKYGTGALNIDGCRIGFASDADERESKNKNRHADFGSGPRENAVFGKDARERGANGNYDPTGRWPANVVLDPEAAALLDEQSGEVGDFAAGSTRTAPDAPSTATVYGTYNRRSSVAHNDSGGASRFFYVAKPDRAERDIGCEDLPAASGGTATDRKDGSAGLDNPRAGAGRSGGARNIHPTVKSIDLMRWLCRLITPRGGLVLDPFMGSGSTGVACSREGFRFIGIERERAYFEIAKRRLVGDAPLFNRSQVQTG